MSEARTQILARIADALRSQPTALHTSHSAAPASEPPPSLAPAAGAPPNAGLITLFCAELRAVNGEVSLVADRDELPKVLQAHVQACDLKRIALQDRPLAAFAAGRIGEALLLRCAGERSAVLHEIESSDCAILEAEALLADSGSVLLMLSGFAERLMPYLAPECIVIADARRLWPRMTEEAMQPAYAAARAGARGEAVVITGPSRTADIEKTLVLGAHGPRSLMVFLLAEGG